MSGSWITKQKAEIHMRSRQQKYTQLTSSAKAGISERSGHTLDAGEWKDPKNVARHWRTRSDSIRTGM